MQIFWANSQKLFLDPREFFQEVWDSLVSLPKESLAKLPSKAISIIYLCPSYALWRVVCMYMCFREGVMEFLLVNHPLDCPICDQAGECDLQVSGLGGHSKLYCFFSSALYAHVLGLTSKSYSFAVSLMRIPMPGFVRRVKKQILTVCLCIL